MGLKLFGLGEQYFFQPNPRNGILERQRKEALPIGDTPGERVRVALADFAVFIQIRKPRGDRRDGNHHNYEASAESHKDPAVLA